MRVPLSWLSDYVDVPFGPEELADRLTLGGFEVEAILRPTAGTRGVVVAEVRGVEPLPDSSRLWLVDVFDGERDTQIVCGASNFRVGDRVPAALPGALLPGGVEIGAKKLRGFTSNGMLASARELGVGDDHRGIWILDREAPVGADLSEWLHLDDPVLDIAVTPDRGYALSIIGLARDLAALTGVEPRPVPQPDLDLPDGLPDLVAVEVVDPATCPRFSATLISGVVVGPSPAWLQVRLAACGARPRSNVVDVTTYAMFETGHPVHAYDRDRLEGGVLVVRRAEPGETLVTLDSEERTLDPDDLVICDREGPVGLAGVRGGQRTEVRDDTTDLVVEVASFDASSVLRTARRHGLFTEASTRFEKVVPDATVPFGADRCVSLLLEVAGGTAVGRSDVAPAPRPRPGIALRPERMRRLLGMDLADDRQAELLGRLGCDVRPAGEVLAVLPPPTRPDLGIEADLAEELARLQGYDQVPETLPAPPAVGGRPPADRARLAVREALAGAGWDEVLAFPFVADTDLERLGLSSDDPRCRPVALTNPLSQEESVLRTTLLPGQFRILRRNVNRQTADVAIFELGHVFLPPTAQEPGADGGPDDVVLPAEPLTLGLAACGSFTPERWDAPARTVDLADLLGAADTTRRAVGLGPLDATPTDERPYHPGRAARLSLDGVDLGVVGELHPRVLAAFELPSRTLAGELRLDRLVGERGIRPFQARQPSALPSLRMDVAAVVDETVPAVQVEAAVRAGAGERLSELTLFDTYRGAQLGEGRKSLAYRLRLDESTRQLTAEDEQSALAAIESALADRVGGALRSG